MSALLAHRSPVCILLDVLLCARRRSPRIWTGSSRLAAAARRPPPRIGGKKYSKVSSSTARRKTLRSPPPLLPSPPSPPLHAQGRLTRSPAWIRHHPPSRGPLSMMRKHLRPSRCARRHDAHWRIVQASVRLQCSHTPALRTALLCLHRYGSTLRALQVAKDSDGFQTPKPCGGKKSGQAKNIPASTHTTNSAPATASARSPHATANPRASANKVPAATSAGGGYQRAGGAHGRRSASPQGTGHQARPAWASNARQGRVPKKRPVPAPPARGKAAAAPPPAQKWTFASVVHGVFTKPEALMCDSVPLAQPSKDAFPPISAAKPAPCTVKPAPPSKKAPSPPHARKASQSLVVPDAVPHLLATATDSNNATQVSCLTYVRTWAISTGKL